MKKNEKMRKKALKQWVSLFLTGLVFTSVCPLQALAVDTGTSTVETTENADESKTLTTISSALPQTSTSSSIEETTATSGSQEENLKPQVRSESVETWMPDENLRNVVAKHLSTRTNPVKPEDITKEAMANLNMLDFDYMDIPADTVVDFTGLEYAGEILSLNTTLIVATNIPELKLGEGCFAYVRPNVLPYLRKSGTIRQLVIKGSNSNGLPSAELVGVGAYINQLAPTEMLRVFTTDMTDFSTLGITIDVPSSLFKSTNYMTTPLELPAINITEGYEGNYFYTQDILIGANGRSLISTEGLRNLRVILWDEDKTSPIPLSYFELTDEGINLNLTGIPSFIKYVEFRFETLARALTYPSYGLRAIAPIQRSTPAADVTVKYLNEKDEEVQASKTIKGKVGDDYDATTAEYKFDTIGDYELDTSKLPSNTKGKLDDQAKEVIYYYKKKVAADVTVQYLNEANQEIHSAKTINGKVGDDYDATTPEYKLPTIDDYVLDESKLPTNAEGKLDDTAKTVTYYYKKAPVPVTGKVTVKYVNETDEEIRTEKSFTGEVDKAYDATTPEYKLAMIDEYVLDESKLPANGKGVFTAAEQTVVYHYKKASAPATSKVIVKYVDEAGQEIREAQTMKGKIGTAYDATTEEYKLSKIDDYVLDESQLPTNGKGQFSATNQPVVYRYKKDSTPIPPMTSKVTVKYVDEAGQEIREAQTIKGEIGTAYDATTADYKLSKIGDYQLDETKLPSNGKGQFGEQEQLVTYVYKKAPKLADTNNKSSATGTNTIVTRVSGVNQKLLPKTGEHTLAANILVVVGMVMIVSALMIFVRKRNI